MKDEGKKDWYERHIEDPLKGIVRYLRDNGVNTECSCGEEMYVQCGYRIDGDLAELKRLVACYLIEHGDEFGFEGINFSLHYTLEVIDGAPMHSAVDVRFPVKENDHDRLVKKKEAFEKKRDYYIRWLKDLEEDMKEIDKNAVQG